MNTKTIFERLIQLFAIISLIMFPVVTSYYFLYHLPSKEYRIASEICWKNGDVQSQKDKTTSPNAAMVGGYAEFNKQYNACLYSSSYIDEGVTMLSIEDLYNNETFLSFSEFKDLGLLKFECKSTEKNACSIEEFWERSEVFMN